MLCRFIHNKKQSLVRNLTSKASIHYRKISSQVKNKMFRRMFSCKQGLKVINLIPFFHLSSFLKRKKGVCLEIAFLSHMFMQPFEVKFAWRQVTYFQLRVLQKISSISPHCIQQTKFLFQTRSFPRIIHRSEVKVEETLASPPMSRVQNVKEMHDDCSV